MSRRKRRRKREAFADAMRSLPFRPRCRPTGADRHGPAAGEGAAPGAANVATSVSFVNASRPCGTSMREPPTDADDDRSCACDGTAKRPLERQLGRISRFNTHRPVANAASRRGLSSRRRRNACRLHQLHERGMLCRDKQTERTKQPIAITTSPVRRPGDFVLPWRSWPLRYQLPCQDCGLRLPVTTFDCARR